MDKCKNKNKNFILYAVILSMFYRTRVRAEEKRKTKEETADINHVKVKLSLARKDRLFRAPLSLRLHNRPAISYLEYSRRIPPVFANRITIVNIR